MERVASGLLGVIKIGDNSITIFRTCLFFLSLSEDLGRKAPLSAQEHGVDRALELLSPAFQRQGLGMGCSLVARQGRTHSFL